MGVEEQPYLMQIHNKPSTKGRSSSAPPLVYDLRCAGERVIVLSHISSLAKLLFFHFSTSFVGKSIHENKHSGVFAPRPSQFRFCACFCRSLSLFFLRERGLIVFTCHIRFIPSNLILPRYLEHLFARRPRMKVLEREFIFLNPLLISSLHCSGGRRTRRLLP